MHCGHEAPATAHSGVGRGEWKGARQPLPAGREARHNRVLEPEPALELQVAHSEGRRGLRRSAVSGAGGAGGAGCAVRVRAWVLRVLRGVQQRRLPRREDNRHEAVWDAELHFCDGSAGDLERHSADGDGDFWNRLWHSRGRVWEPSGEGGARQRGARGRAGRGGGAEVADAALGEELWGQMRWGRDRGHAIGLDFVAEAAAHGMWWKVALR